MNIPPIAPNDLLTGALAVLVAAVAIAYFVGAQAGRRRASELTRLAVERLRPLGTDATFTWLGRTGCEVRLGKIRPPFAGIRMVVWLEPREVVPLWIINRIRGRRDLVGVAADLVVAPRVSFELVDPRSAAGRRALSRSRQRGWTESSWTFAGRPMVVASPHMADARTMIPRLSQGSLVEKLALARLGVSGTSPHLGVTIGDPNALRAADRALVDWLTRIAETLSEAPGPNRPVERPKPPKQPRSRRSGR